MELDQRIRLLIGEMVIQNTALQIENEKLKVQVAAMTKAPEEPPPQPTPEREPAPSQDQ